MTPRREPTRLEGAVLSQAVERKVLGDAAARQLANTQKTVPQMGSITPRWLPRFLSWVPVEAGVYRVNRVKETDSAQVVVCTSKTAEPLPTAYVDYVEKPREYVLSSIKATLGVHTRISDLFNSPHDQVKEQSRLMVEQLKERQEFELVNNADYGLLKNVAPSMRIPTRKGPPTRTTWTSCWRRCGRSPRSSWPIRAPSPPSAANARAVACRRPRSRCSAVRSSPGAGFRYFPATSCPSRA